MGGVGVRAVTVFAVERGRFLGWEAQAGKRTRLEPNLDEDSDANGREARAHVPAAPAPPGSLARRPKLKTSSPKGASPGRRKSPPAASSWAAAATARVLIRPRPRVAEDEGEERRSREVRKEQDSAIEKVGQGAGGRAWEAALGLCRAEREAKEAAHSGAIEGRGHLRG